MGMQLNAFETAQHLEETGAVKSHAVMMSPEDRHRLAFVLQVCDELRIERSFENVMAVSRAIDKEGVEPHIARQYPKWVEAGDGSDVVVENAAQETFAAGLTPIADAQPRKKPSPYPKAEKGTEGGNGEPFPSYVAPPAPVGASVLAQGQPAQKEPEGDKNDGEGNGHQDARARDAVNQTREELAQPDPASKPRSGSRK